MSLDCCQETRSQNIGELKIAQVIVNIVNSTGRYVWAIDQAWWVKMEGLRPGCVCVLFCEFYMEQDRVEVDKLARPKSNHD